MRIYIGSDHAGFELKEFLKKTITLGHQKIEWMDLGTHSKDSVDYPDYANKVSEQLNSIEKENIKNKIIDSILGPAIGVLICGSGQGMSIRSNKYPYVRAALCWNEEITRLSREHNNANILCLGARFLDDKKAIELVDIFISTAFAGGRHQQRVNKLISQ